MKSIQKTEKWKERKKEKKFKQRKFNFKVISTAQPIMHRALNDHVILCPGYGKGLRSVKLGSLKLFNIKNKKKNILKDFLEISPVGTLKKDVAQHYVTSSILL